MRINHGKRSEINVTPLVDVMLVLLIIFMVAAPMSKVGINVDLPKTTKSSSLKEEDDPIIITINDDGKIFFKDEEILEEDISSKLQTIVKDDARVYVRGDQKLSYGRIVEVMDKIVSSGYSKVSLITEMAKK